MLVNCQSPLPAALHWLYIISCPGWCLLWDKEKPTVIQTVIQNTSTQLCSFHIDKEMLLLEWLSDSCTFAHTWLPIEKLLFFVYIWCRNRALREQCVLKARSFSLWRKTAHTALSPRRIDHFMGAGLAFCRSAEGTDIQLKGPSLDYLKRGREWILKWVVIGWCGTEVTNLVSL